MASNSAMDRLVREVRKKGPICIGLDPHIDHLPAEIAAGKSPGARVAAVNRAIIDATADLAAVYKPQAAYYEALGLEGWKALADTVTYLREKGALVIMDAKRGDIASTASMYAKAFFEGALESDFLTLNPYMGADSIEPYMPYVRECGKGLFVIAKTSNPGSRDIECLLAQDGQPIYDHVGRMLEAIEGNAPSSEGYRPIGLVVGATAKADGEGEAIRRSFPDSFFLVPGYGAQGGGALDAQMLLQGGNGGVVNSSRGIIRAYASSELPFAEATRAAVLAMKEDLCGRI